MSILQSRHCNKRFLVSPRFIPPHNLEKHSTPVGCEHCYYTGYLSRKAIYELIPIDDEMASIIRENKQTRLEDSHKIKFLEDAAWNLFAEGLTSIEEVYPFFI